MNDILNIQNKQYLLRVIEVNKSPEELFELIQYDLQKEEQDTFKEISHNKRKKEWLSVRILLKEMLGKYTRIYYDEHRNPYIKGEYDISVTHSKNIVGIILSKEKSTGIDSEILSERILRTAHKFIPENILHSFPEEMKIKYCYLHWCSKETLFKIKGGGGIDFLKNLEVNVPEINDFGKVNGFFHKNDLTEHFDIFYRFIDHKGETLLITWY